MPASSSVPFFGICLGLQCAVIEFARNVVGLEDANSTEFDRDCQHPVVCMLDEQYAITDKGGTMRLGSYPVPARRGQPGASGVRRHCWSTNGTGTATSSTTSIASSSRPTAWRSPAPAPTASWSRSIELRDHPWFVAVQCHPEFKSKPTDAHPLFRGFIEACVQRREAKKNAEGTRPRSLPAVETLSS